MTRQIQDIEHYDSKVNNLFAEAEKSASGLFDMVSLGKRIGLNDKEIEAMNYYLKRNDMIEKVDGSLFRISRYGRMLQSGQITHGYVPI